MSAERPSFGHTKSGLPVHRRSADHLPGHSPYARFNKRVAIAITAGVGSMTCAYLFSLLALASLPAVLTQAFSLHVFPHWLVSVGLIALVAWVAQTFLQLVLLSIILVGGNVSAEASDARAEKTFTDVERLIEGQDHSAEILAALKTLLEQNTALTGDVHDLVKKQAASVPMKRVASARPKPEAPVVPPPSPPGGPGTAGKKPAARKGTEK